MQCHHISDIVCYHECPVITPERLQQHEYPLPGSSCRSRPSVSTSVRSLASREQFAVWSFIRSAASGALESLFSAYPSRRNHGAAAAERQFAKAGCQASSNLAIASDLTAFRFSVIERDAIATDRLPLCPAKERRSCREPLPSASPYIYGPQSPARPRCRSRLDQGQPREEDRVSISRTTPSPHIDVHSAGCSPAPAAARTLHTPALDAALHNGGDSIPVASA